MLTKNTRGKFLFSVSHIQRWELRLREVSNMLQSAGARIGIHVCLTLMFINLINFFSQLLGSRLIFRSEY